MIIVSNNKKDDIKQSLIAVNFHKKKILIIIGLLAFIIGIFLIIVGIVDDIEALSYGIPLTTIILLIFIIEFVLLNLEIKKKLESIYKINGKYEQNIKVNIEDVIQIENLITLEKKHLKLEELLVVINSKNNIILVTTSDYYILTKKDLTESQANELYDIFKKNYIKIEKIFF